MQRQQSSGAAGGRAECILCSEEIQVFGFFDCGHVMCDKCALRLRLFRSGTGKKSGGPAAARSTPADTNCPVCRAPSSKLVLTDIPPGTDEGYSKVEMQNILEGAVPATTVRALINGDHAAARVNLLTGFFCPQNECWLPDPVSGASSQEAFLNIEMLKDHLKFDHGMKYCKLCMDFRPAFLSEQIPFTGNELDQHNRGRCGKDPSSFVGHPLCLFCGQRFYDGDALLEHMQMSHESCHICNAGEFTFVYYKNREYLYRHYDSFHRLCTHKDCAAAEPIERVFRDEVALQAHMISFHGQSQRLSPAALGFNFSVGAMTSPASSSAAASAAASRSHAGFLSGPANPSNTHADRIIFDFINKREEVVTSPDLRRAEHHAAGAAAASGESDAELKKRLGEALKTHLRSDQMDPLRTYSKAYLEGKSKATEYFSQLQSLLPNDDALNAVFSPLVATIPDRAKRESLIAAKTMLMSREAAALRQAAAEKAKANELEEMKKRHAAQRQALKTAKAAAPRGVWTKSTAPSVLGGSPAPAAPSGSASPSSMSWMSPVSPTQAAPALARPAAPLAGGAAAFMDPEAFPVLESASGNGKKRGTGPRAGPPSNNAWGRR